MVTGATGFFGSHFAAVCEEGAEIFATSRAAREDVGATFSVAASRSERYLRGSPHADRRQTGYRFPSFGHRNRSFRAGARASDAARALVSTVNLLTVAAEIGIARVILAGSLQEPKPDHAEPTPSSPYAAAKWASSAYGRMFRRIYGLPVVNLRVFQTYGPGQDVQKLIPYVTLALLRQQRPELSNGKWEADWIYIDDVISGLLAAARARDVPERTIDIGSGSLISVREIVMQLVHLTGSLATPIFGAMPDRPLEPVRVADAGWRAERIELETGRFNDRRASAYCGRLQANY